MLVWLRRAVTFLLVPLLSIIGNEIWSITSHLRYQVSQPDLTQTMKAVVYSSHGPAREVLFIDAGRPQPVQPAAPGFIVIQVVAAALNPVDFKQLRNKQPDALVPKPRIAGFDVSGIVLSAGAGSNFAVGDAVYGMLPLVGSPWGSLSEVTAAEARCFAKAPTSIPLEDAAALPLVGLTVMQVTRPRATDPPLHGRSSVTACKTLIWMPRLSVCSVVQWTIG